MGLVKENSDSRINFQLAKISKLPFRLTDVEFFFQDRPSGFRYKTNNVSVTGKYNNEIIVGCGEDEERDSAIDKATSELVERACLFHFGKEHGATSSNGWAVHNTHGPCCQNAVNELIERDAVLSQWYSRTSFKVLSSNSIPVKIQNWVQQELSRSEFPMLRVLLSTEGLGPSITVVLMNKKGHGVFGHSTKNNLDEAIDSALTEACRAAHLAIRRVNWNDSLKLKNRELGAVSPGAHGILYAHHEILPAWIFGEEVSENLARIQYESHLESAHADPGLEYSVLMALPFAVGFAGHPDAFELSWGVTDAVKIFRTRAAYRMNLKLNEINDQPHVVA